MRAATLHYDSYDKPRPQGTGLGIYGVAIHGPLPRQFSRVENINDVINTYFLALPRLLQSRDLPCLRPEHAFLKLLQDGIHQPRWTREAV